MKKHVFFYLLLLLLILPGSARAENPIRSGMFVSMIQNPPALSSREEIMKLIDFTRKARIQTLFVQIYRANKAWFPSRIADSTLYDAAFLKIGEDPFKLLIREAHKSGIEVHAWLNLLSLSANEKAPILQKYGPEILTKNLKNKKTLQDYKIDNQYFLEPGDPRVRKEIENIVSEILEVYPNLDGIQFDYIRYPDKNPHYGFTRTNVERFKRATGIQVIEEQNDAWKDWKRRQVTELLEILIKKTRTIRPNIQISTTGCMPYIRAYAEAFQDWPSWANRGLIDFVTIMSYPDQISEFRKYIADAKQRVKDFSKINIGIGAYKLVHSPATFSEDFRLCEQSGGGACVIFHYGSLLENTSLSSFLIDTYPQNEADQDLTPKELFL